MSSFTNDVKTANSHISAMALTTEWSNLFRKYALNETEGLSDDPASSFNVFLHLTAQSAAKCMYEQAARINEVNESTAILPKSLLNKLNSEELIGIFGKPSETTIAFCVQEKDIIDNAVPNTGFENDPNATRYLVVNKDMNIRFEGHPDFVLPYDIIINCKPNRIKKEDTLDGTTYYTSYNIYATYDIPLVKNDGMRDIYAINSPNISSRKMRFNGNTYIAFFLKVFQINRKTVEFYVSDPMATDTTIQFDNYLVGFEVFRKKNGTTDFYLMGPGTPEGNINNSENSYNYSYDYKRNSNNVNFIFNKSTDSTGLKSGDTIKIIVYTTNGSEGNIKFPYMINNLNSLTVNYNQDLTKINQNKMLNIIVLAFARDTESINGKDQMSLEEIRNTIISKKYSRQILITNNEIVNKAKELGLDAYKARHDIISLYYRAVAKLNYQNMILSTGMNDFEFNINDIEPLEQNPNIRLIKPTDSFKYDNKNKKFNFISGENNYLDYVNEYNQTSDVESILQGCFPFYIQYKNTANPSINIYDMNINQTEFLEFNTYNEELSLDKVDISYLKIMRNPFKGRNNGSFDKNMGNTYYIQFVVYTGENTLLKLYEQAHMTDGNNYVNSENLENYYKQYLRFNIKLIGITNRNTLQINPTNLKITNVETMINDGYISYQASFTTDNYVTDEKQINLYGVKNISTSSEDYSTNALIDTTISIQIDGIFNEDETTISNKVAIGYKTENINLVSYYKDYYGIDFDIKTVFDDYLRWEEDIPEKYNEVIYEKNLDYEPDNSVVTDPNHYEWKIEVDDHGKPIFNTLLDGFVTPKFKVLFNVGDIKYEYINPDDNTIRVPEIDYDPETMKNYIKMPIILHKKGEYKYFYKDTNGKDVLVEDENDESASANLAYYLLPSDKRYVGVLKNVSWIDRIYFSNEEMYDNIRKLYIDLVDKLSIIKNLLFEGGEIFAGLKRTSGISHKYKAYNLNTGESKYINNIALSIHFRVKFNDNISNDYKEKEIIDATVQYISELGDNDLSIDNLFDYIKQTVTDIKYINLLKINDYYNGEVQTITNDTSVTDESITISQKVTVSEDGKIEFTPNVTVDVISEN